MNRLRVLALCALCAAPPAQAQLNLNRLLDSAKNVGKAAQEIGRASCRERVYHPV